MDQKLSALPTTLSLAGGDKLYVINGGVSKGITFDDLKAQIPPPTDITGNAATSDLADVATVAVALQTPRLINSVAFDGSADITIASAAGTLTG